LYLSLIVEIWARTTLISIIREFSFVVYGLEVFLDGFSLFFSLLLCYLMLDFNLTFLCNNTDFFPV